MTHGRHSRNDIALRKAHGHDSTSAFVHAEGQKHLNATQLKKLNRVREGLCPECGKEVPEEVKQGRLKVGGHVVRKCVDCRLKWQIYTDERKKRAMAEAGHANQVANQEDGMANKHTTLLGERLKAADEIVVAKRHFDQRPESIILIVGGRTTNIQRSAREHKRVLMWESTHLRDKVTPTMPTNVSVIMCTRFCSHAVSQELRNLAQQRRAFIFGGLLQSGEMRRNLTELLDLDASQVNEDADDIAETPPSKPFAATQAATIIRPSTPASAPRAVEPPQPVQEPAPMVSRDRSVVFPEGGDLDSKINDAISMVGEAIAALSLVKDQLETTREAITQNAEALKKLTALKEIFRGL